MPIIFLLPWLEELEKCDSCTEKCCLPIMRGSVGVYQIRNKKLQIHACAYRSTHDRWAAFFSATVEVFGLFQPRQQENDSHPLLLAPG